MQTQHPNNYPSIEAFYSENEARRRSMETDYGVWWMDENPWPHYRISYVQATGEVYVIQTGDHNEAEGQVLGVVPSDPGSQPYKTGESYYKTLAHILDGWAEHCGKPSGLDWVWERLAPFRGGYNAAATS